ncbi:MULTISPECIES: hypothetical protein [Acinetobacter]|uniref:Uncharacterized protein n=1 Tax=Acinetobacter piscicola TaxID=2006115 RepID=A0A7S7AFV1_9GAMM|nr:MULTISPECIES: hypothetical protein [Acinetobacter]QOW44452.1 hypothetical protein G0028_00165 [Acinetobacter piscicola]
MGIEIIICEKDKMIHGFYLGSYSAFYLQIPKKLLVTFPLFEKLIADSGTDEPLSLSGETVLMELILEMRLLLLSVGQQQSNLNQLFVYDDFPMSEQLYLELKSFYDTLRAQNLDTCSITVC